MAEIRISASNGEFLYEDRRDSDLESAVGSRGNATGVKLWYLLSTSPAVQGWERINSDLSEDTKFFTRYGKSVTIVWSIKIYGDKNDLCNIQDILYYKIFYEIKFKYW